MSRRHLRLSLRISHLGRTRGIRLIIRNPRVQNLGRHHQILFTVQRRPPINRLNTAQRRVRSTRNRHRRHVQLPFSCALAAAFNRDNVLPLMLPQHIKHGARAFHNIAARHHKRPKNQAERCRAAEGAHRPSSPTKRLLSPIFGTFATCFARRFIRCFRKKCALTHETIGYPILQQPVAEKYHIGTLARPQRTHQPAL